MNATTTSTCTSCGGPVTFGTVSPGRRVGICSACGRHYAEAGATSGRRQGTATRRAPRGQARLEDVAPWWADLD